MRILREFPNKQWSQTAIRMLLWKIDRTSSVSHKQGSGRPRSVTTRRGQHWARSRSHLQPGKWSRDWEKSEGNWKKETGISRSSVCRIARHDVQLKVFERKKGTCCLTLIEFLQQNVPDDIKQALWPTNSPDMNSVDYAVCGALQQMVYRDSITSLNDLKEKIRRCWVELSQKLFDCAVDQLDLDYMPLSRPREAILNSCLTDFLSMSVWDLSVESWHNAVFHCFSTFSVHMFNA